VTFAPKDVCQISFVPKTNNHGIGYHGLDPKLLLGHVRIMTAAPLGGSGAGHRGIRGQVRVLNCY